MSEFCYISKVNFQEIYRNMKKYDEETFKLKIIDGYEYVHCTVCGTLTMVYDICADCGWQNTGETNIDGGPNKITLLEARRRFKNGEKLK